MGWNCQPVWTMFAVRSNFPDKVEVLMFFVGRFDGVPIYWFGHHGAGLSNTSWLNHIS